MVEMRLCSMKRGENHHYFRHHAKKNSGMKKKIDNVTLITDFVLRWYYFKAKLKNMCKCAEIPQINSMVKKIIRLKNILTGVCIYNIIRQTYMAEKTVVCAWIYVKPLREIKLTY